MKMNVYTAVVSSQMIHVLSDDMPRAIGLIVKKFPNLFGEGMTGITSIGLACEDVIRDDQEVKL